MPEQKDPKWTKLAQQWNETARSALEGRTIKHVRYLTQKEAETLGFSNSGVLMMLDNGTLVWPSADDEGNDAGSLHTTLDGHGAILPVLPSFWL